MGIRGILIKCFWWYRRSDSTRFTRNTVVISSEEFGDGIASACVDGLGGCSIWIFRRSNCYINEAISSGIELIVFAKANACDFSSVYFGLCTVRDG